MMKLMPMTMTLLTTDLLRKAIATPDCDAAPRLSLDTCSSCFHFLHLNFHFHFLGYLLTPALPSICFISISTFPFWVISWHTWTCFYFPFLFASIFGLVSSIFFNSNFHFWISLDTPELASISYFFLLPFHFHRRLSLDTPTPLASIFISCCYHFLLFNFHFHFLLTHLLFLPFSCYSISLISISTFTFWVISWHARTCSHFLFLWVSFFPIFTFSFIIIISWHNRICFHFLFLQASFIPISTFTFPPQGILHFTSLPSLPNHPLPTLIRMVNLATTEVMSVTIPLFNFLTLQCIALTHTAPFSRITLQVLILCLLPAR